jgi:hypothetical protein
MKKFQREKYKPLDFNYNNKIFIVTLVCKNPQMKIFKPLSKNKIKILLKLKRKTV